MDLTFVKLTFTNWYREYFFSSYCILITVAYSLHIKHMFSKNFGPKEQE